MMQSQRIGSLVLVPKVSKRLKNSIIGWWKTNPNTKAKILSLILKKKRNFKEKSKH
jgi:hypothetical protein